MVQCARSCERGCIDYVAPLHSPLSARVGPLGLHALPHLRKHARVGGVHVQPVNNGRYAPDKGFDGLAVLAILGSNVGSPNVGSMVA